MCALNAKTVHSIAPAYEILYLVADINTGRKHFESNLRIQTHYSD